MSYLKQNWPALCVIGLGSLVSLAIAFAPFEFLYLYVIPDDAYYYFQVARNIVHGLGSTFDGVNPTNGYHPLWMLLLLPIFKLFSAPVVMDVAPIHAALVLSAMFHAAFGLALLAIISRYTKSNIVKVLALASWYFNPFNFYQISDGLETALSLLCIASFLLVSLRYVERSSKFRLAAVGLVGGLMMLSRLDNLFYFLMFLAWLLYEQGIRGSARNVLFVGVVATIVVSPWLIFNYLAFGMLFTSASLAYTIINHAIIIQDNGPSLFQQLKAVVFMTDFSLRGFVTPRTGAPSVYFVLLGVAVGWLVFVGGGLRRILRDIPLEFFIFGGFVLNFISNASIRWSPREWYFIAFNLFLAIGVAWVLERLRERDRLRPFIVAIVALLVLSLYFISWSKNYRDVAERPQVMRVTLWMNENLPEGTIVGAFNAGIEGYFSTHRLINLDGLVNNRAYEAIRNKDLWAYITSEHIEYICDFKNRIDYRMRSVLGIDNSILDHLVLVYPREGGNPSVYRVK